MTHLDIELQKLKQEVLEMWELTLFQLEKAQKSLRTNDKNLAREVIINERRMNAYELKIDRDSENILALFSPVAVDLRCVLAVLKIINNLERIADIAEGVAKFVLELKPDFDHTILENTEADRMFNQAIQMVKNVYVAFDKEDTTSARAVFELDDVLDEINGNAVKVISNYIRTHLELTESALYVLSTIRKLERIGDQAKNIAEEIIFYIEAKVLKHKNKVEKGD